MLYKLLGAISILAMSGLLANVVASPVMQDSGVELSKTELENVLQFLPVNILNAALDDEAARIDIIGQMLVGKKIAAAAEKVTQEENPQFYWNKVFLIRKTLNDLFLKKYDETIKTPDMTALLEEQFLVNKEKYGKVPEYRVSSHILFKCMGKDCDRVALKPKVEKVYAELKNGANFEEMVEKYSEDPGSKARKGKLKKYFLSQPHVNERFLTGLFAIEKVGGYSDIVESKFGFHIIRLDEIMPQTYKTFEEVKPELAEAYDKKYKDLAMKSYLKTFDLTADLKIDKDMINAIFEEKKKQDEIEAAKKPVSKPKNSFK